MRIALSLTIAALISVLFASSVYASGATYAILTKKVNSVKVLTTTSKHWEDAELNQQYRPGDMIRTEGDSLAQIELSDGSVIKLSEYTQIMINPVEREVHLDIGKLFLKFVKGEKNPKVKTPTAVAAALGTMWVQGYNAAGTTDIHVLEHQVELQSGGVAQVVNEGQFTSAASGQPPLSPQAFDVKEYLKTEPVLENLNVPAMKEVPIASSRVIEIFPDASTTVTEVPAEASSSDAYTPDTDPDVLKKLPPVEYAVIKHKTGNVQVFLRSSGVWKTAEVGRKYFLWDIIRTDSGATAKIELSNNFVFNMQASKQVTIKADMIIYKPKKAK